MLIEIINVESYCREGCIFDVVVGFHLKIESVEVLEFVWLVCFDDSVCESNCLIVERYLGNVSG